MLAGCAGAPTGPDEPVTLEVEPSEATLDEDVVTYTLRLTVREEFSFEHRGCPPEILDAEVQAPGGPVPLYGYGEEGMAGACVITTVTLQPGEHTRVVHWNGRMQANPSEPHGGDRAPAGTYTVVARLVARDHVLTANASVTVVG